MTTTCKTFLFLLCLITFPTADFFAQTPPKPCYFQTDGKGKSAGVKMKMQIGCNWTAQESSQPHIVKTFVDYDKGLLCTLIIATLDETPKPGPDILITPQNLKALLSSYGKITKTNYLHIGKLSAAEVDLVNQVEDVTTRYLVYVFPTDKNLILIRYGVGGPDKSAVAQKANKYRPFFSNLARQVSLLE